jgi:hypothetical protein
MWESALHDHNKQTRDALEHVTRYLSLVEEMGTSLSAFVERTRKKVKVEATTRELPFTPLALQSRCQKPTTALNMSTQLITDDKSIGRWPKAVQ